MLYVCIYVALTVRPPFNFSLQISPSSGVTLLSPGFFYDVNFFIMSCIIRILNKMNFIYSIVNVGIDVAFNTDMH